MSIRALPPSTASPLLATTLISSPLAVAKEILDNALDARATSISHHPLPPFLTLRDNGTGIPPSSRPLLGRRSHTSKLASFDELRLLGGQSLGFRGEALAAIAEVADEVRVVTRVEGEATAVGMRLMRGGGIGELERMSAPVGTSVLVSGLFVGWPVRRKGLEREAGRWVGEVRRLVEGYALARPEVRFAMKVKGVGAKSGDVKGDWVYAPRAGDGVEQAARKVVGRACLGICEWFSKEHEGYCFKALLPKADADREKISGVGQFVSVDGRILNEKRGTARKMVGLWKERMKKVGVEGGKNPVLLLNLTCPLGSYDVNVEPGKDDVVFVDKTVLVEGWTGLIEEAYKMKTGENPEEYHLAEAMKAISSDELEMVPEDLIDEDTQPTYRRRDSVRSNMYSDIELDDEDEPHFPASRLQDQNGTRIDEEQDQESQDVTISNPWVIAKMNAPLRKPVDATTPNNKSVTLESDVRSLQPGSTQPRSRAPVRATNPFDKIPYLPTPQASSSPPRTSGSEPSLEQMGIFPYSSMRPATDEAERISPQPTRGPQPVNYTPPQCPEGTPLGMIPDITLPSQRRPRRQNAPPANINKPFVSPVSFNVDRSKRVSNRASTQQAGSPKSGRNWHQQIQDAAKVLVPKGDEAMILEGPAKNKRIEEYMVPRGDRRTSSSPLMDIDNVTPIEHSHMSTMCGSQGTQRQISQCSSALQEIPNEANRPSQVQQAEIPSSPYLDDRLHDPNAMDIAPRAIHCTRASQLALERVPDDARTQNLSLRRNVAAVITPERLRWLRHGDTYDRLPWTFPPTDVDPQNVLMESIPDDRLHAWCCRIETLLRRGGQRVNVAMLQESLRRALGSHVVTVPTSSVESDSAVALH
ncbi:MAG: hypothetical protein Q9157_000970 [Trypethelium eluteriae]